MQNCIVRREREGLLVSESYPKKILAKKNRTDKKSARLFWVELLLELVVHADCVATSEDVVHTVYA